MANKLQEFDIPIAFGGRIFNLAPEMQDRIPGHFLGESLEEAPGIVTQLLNHSIPVKKVKELSQTYKSVLNTFQNELANIESQIWQEMNISAIPYTHLRIANLNLSQNIIAALTLGDISFLGVDIDWAKNLFENLGIPQELLDRYLSAYAEAITNQLGEGGHLISNYLNTLVSGE